MSDERREGEIRPEDDATTRATLAAIDAASAEGDDLTDDAARDRRAAPAPHAPHGAAAAAGADAVAAGLLPPDAAELAGTPRTTEAADDATSAEAGGVTANPEAAVAAPPAPIHGSATGAPPALPPADVSPWARGAYSPPPAWDASGYAPPPPLPLPAQPGAGLASSPPPWVMPAAEPAAVVVPPAREASPNERRKKVQLRSSITLLLFLVGVAAGVVGLRLATPTRVSTPDAFPSLDRSGVEPIPAGAVAQELARNDVHGLAQLLDGATLTAIQTQLKPLVSFQSVTFVGATALEHDTLAGYVVRGRDQDGNLGIVGLVIRLRDGQVVAQ